jgi:hypothetical protein
VGGGHGGGRGGWLRLLEAVEMGQLHRISKRRVVEAGGVGRGW